nr:Chain C, SHP3 [Streptococcus thermophilus CNRZ1066]7JI0_D Chain D, SHP3 [Streptococcus thermophilus CNRZ1066]
DIIIIVGG